MGMWFRTDKGIYKRKPNGKSLIHKTSFAVMEITEHSGSGQVSHIKVAQNYSKLFSCEFKFYDIGARLHGPESP